jgi:hypothetical protein
MSLRARLLAAFAYVLVLVIVALMVPLALNLSRRVDAEIKSEAQGQAQLLAAGAAGRLDDPDQLDELVRNASERLGGRVIVVDRDGGLLVDSAGAGLRSTSYATRPEIARALAGHSPQRLARRGPPVHRGPGGASEPARRGGARDAERRRRSGRGPHGRDRAGGGRRGGAVAGARGGVAPCQLARQAPARSGADGAARGRR